jgi:excisionase family DNA binding protein
MLSVNKRTIYDWVYEKRIPYYKIGGILRFSSDEIDNWLKKKRCVATTKRSHNHDQDKGHIS